MDINNRISGNNPVWDANTILNSVFLTTTAVAGGDDVQQLAVQGKYCIISNTSAVVLYVGNDIRNVSATTSAYCSVLWFN